MSGETPTPWDWGMADYKEAVRRLRDGHPDEALVLMRRALEIAPRNPFYLSYAGLLVALAERRFQDAESLCLEALGLRRNHARLYLNLAEVYQTAGRPHDAIEVLEKGLASTGRDSRILEVLNDLGTRRKPMLPFLDRANPINRILGKCRHRLLGPRRSA